MIKVGDRVKLISVPQCSDEDLNRCGVVTYIGYNTGCGRDVDILLDGDDGVSAVFDHQLEIIKE